MPKRPKDKNVLTLLCPEGTNLWLNRYAFERGVSKNKLCMDLLTLAVIAGWDPDDPTLQPKRVGAPLPQPPVNPPGKPFYLDTLPFRLPQDSDGD